MQVFVSVGLWCPNPRIQGEEVHGDRTGGKGEARWNWPSL